MTAFSKRNSQSGRIKRGPRTDNPVLWKTRDLLRQRRQNINWVGSNDKDSLKAAVNDWVDDRL